MTITAKFAGHCIVCGKSIAAGEKIEWAKGKGSTHTRCVGKQPEPLNSRQPAQMIPPDADLPQLAQKFGRAIDGEPKLVSFMLPGKDRKPGEIIKRKSGRFLVLSVGPARYYSRDYLEDMDMFSMEPGHYVDAQAVKVRASESEASEEAQAARKKEVEALLRHSYSAASHSFSAPSTELTKLYGDSRTGGSETWYIGADGIVYYCRSDYDMGPSWWATAATAELIKEAKTLGVKP